MKHNPATVRAICDQLKNYRMGLLNKTEFQRLVARIIRRDREIARTIAELRN